MLILIKTPKNTFSLEIQLEDGIETLYHKVVERTGQKRYQFSLMYAGEILSSSTSKNTIGGNGIKKESTIHMVIIKEFKLTISHKDKSFNIEIPNNEGLLISHLKTHIKTQLLEAIDELSKEEYEVILLKNSIRLRENSNLQETLNNGDIIELSFFENSIIKQKEQQELKQSQQDDDLLKEFIDNLEEMSSDVEIVFCFDTTGSMSSIIGNVKREVTNTVERLMTDIPNIKIGIIGLGDYVDANKLTTVLDLTSNQSDIIKFIKEVPNTSGGDAPEAYEYALFISKSLSWSTHTSKAFVMIGDECPHEPSFTSENYNWFKEADDLHNLGVKIYGVKALGKTGDFYDELAERTGGISIDFKNFNLITKMFLAICYREASKTQFDKYKSEIKDENDKDLNKILDDLNQENFQVLKAEEPLDNNESSSTTTTTTTSTTNNDINNNNNNNNNNSNEKKKKVIVKEYGIPTKMRNNHAWYDHSLDTKKTPTFKYSEHKGHFEKFNTPVTITTKIEDTFKKTGKAVCNIM